MPCARASIVRAIFDKSTKDLSYLEDIFNWNITTNGKGFTFKAKNDVYLTI